MTTNKILDIPCIRYEKPGDLENHRLEKVLSYAYGLLCGNAPFMAQEEPPEVRIECLYDHKGVLHIHMPGRPTPLEEELITYLIVGWYVIGNEHLVNLGAIPDLDERMFLRILRNYSEVLGSEMEVSWRPEEVEPRAA